MTAREYLEDRIYQITDRTIWWKLEVFAGRKAFNLEVDDMLDAVREIAIDKLLTKRGRPPQTHLGYDERNGHMVAFIGDE